MGDYESKRRRSSRLVGSFLPAFGIATAVPNGQDENLVFVKLVIQDVGKSAKLPAARLAVDARPDLGVPLDLCDADFETLNDSRSETRTSLLVPLPCRVNVVPSNMTEDRSEAHSSAQSCARTSSQGTTSSG